MDGLIAFVVVVVLTMGGTTFLWTTAALVRLLARTERRRPALGSPAPRDVAVIIAAFNEELTIAETVHSASRVLPVENVFVVSDGSTDATSAAASGAGATVLDLAVNRGKAGAIETIIREFELAQDFEIVLLLDADTQLDDDYLTTGLPAFADPEVVAVAGHATTMFDPAPPTLLGRLLIAYRERLYIAVQYLHKFGQAARRVNAVSIVPGFASMYRSRVLADIDIAAPGLAIEDYNMTFEVHAKRLGRIAFHPAAARARTQDPSTLRDYVRQVRRWNLGFWQTVARHGVHRGRFWAALTLFLVELLASSLLLVLAPVLVTVLATATLLDGTGADQTGIAGSVAGVFPLWALVAGLLLPDLLLTLVALAISRRPSYLLFAPLFPALRILDAALCLRALVDALTGVGDGRWVSPVRRNASAVV